MIFVVVSIEKIMTITATELSPALIFLELRGFEVEFFLAISTSPNFYHINLLTMSENSLSKDDIFIFIRPSSIPHSRSICIETLSHSQGFR